MTQSNETQTVAGRQLGPVAPSSVAAFDFISHLARQAAWSEKTFGPGPRVEMVIDHIRKELIEIEADPADLEEWVDLIILALDGAWRAGATPQAIIDGIIAKQTKNEGRTWPDWRTSDPNKAIEHDRSSETGSQATPPAQQADEEPHTAWSANEEDFNAESLQDLLDCNDDLELGRTVWFGTAIRPTADQLCDAEDIISLIGDRARDIAGEYADDFPDVTKDAEQELDTVVSAWIEKHCKPSFWTVKNVQPYVLTADDFDVDNERLQDKPSSGAP